MGKHLEKNVPELRFPEFEGRWRNGILGNHSERISSGKNSRSEKKIYPLYRSTGLINYCDDASYQQAAILVARVGANAGTLYKVDGKYGVTDNTLVIIPNSDVIYDFCAFILENAKLNRLVFGSGQPLVTGKMLQNLKIRRPSIAEQKKIASFLGAVDEKLGLLRRKRDLLTDYKRGAMQQLFSQKIRFTRNDGTPYPDWEEKKLGDVCRVTTGKLDANAMVEGGKYRFYTCAKEYFNINTYAFDTEALLVSGNGANVGYIHRYKGKFNAYQRTYVLTGFVENIQYIEKYLEAKLALQIVREKKAGNTPYIVMSTLSEMKLLLPAEEEQQKIADFLTALDAKIDATTSKITALEVFKKGLLQKMFV